eukprot:scaffold65249_cov48-Phaeocystis_antarctica.AAC.1
MPSLRLGRAQTPCPTPTSCSSVVRGRATRPSPIARAGVLWEAARKTETLVRNLHRREGGGGEETGTGAAQQPTEGCAA